MNKKLQLRIFVMLEQLGVARDSQGYAYLVEVISLLAAGLQIGEVCHE